MKILFAAFLLPFSLTANAFYTIDFETACEVAFDADSSGPVCSYDVNGDSRADISFTSESSPYLVDTPRAPGRSIEIRNVNYDETVPFLAGNVIRTSRSVCDGDTQPYDCWNLLRVDFAANAQSFVEFAYTDYGAGPLSISLFDPAGNEIDAATTITSIPGSYVGSATMNPVKRVRSEFSEPVAYVLINPGSGVYSSATDIDAFSADFETSTNATACKQADIAGTWFFTGTAARMKTGRIESAISCDISFFPGGAIDRNNSSCEFRKANGSALSPTVRGSKFVLRRNCSIQADRITTTSGNIVIEQSRLSGDKHSMSLIGRFRSRPNTVVIINGIKQ